jgi:hypothetical protein
MFTVTAARGKVARLAHSVQDRYAGADEDRPLAGYALTMAAYGTVVGALAGTARLTGRQVPDRVPVTDVALGALAIEKLSRLLAKDSVTSPLRAPFTAYQGTSGPAELDEEVRGKGVQKVVGELVTCPFCRSVWVATGFRRRAGLPAPDHAAYRRHPRRPGRRGPAAVRPRRAGEGLVVTADAGQAAARRVSWPARRGPSSTGSAGRASSRSRTARPWSWGPGCRCACAGPRPRPACPARFRFLGHVRDRLLVRGGLLSLLHVLPGRLSLLTSRQRLVPPYCAGLRPRSTPPSRR